MRKVFLLLVVVAACFAIASALSPATRAHKLNKLLSRWEKTLDKVERIIDGVGKNGNDVMSESVLSNGDTLRATTGVNIRSGPCTSNGVVKTLQAGQTVAYTGTTKSGCGYTWYSVSGPSGWIASNYVTVVGGGGGGSSKGQIAANFAVQQVGKCYSQAANLRMGPKCFDCSGLVYQAWKAAGVDIGATWTGAYPGRTREVSASNIQVGDILWRQGHVGIYIGNNQIVNAENEKNGVKQRAFSGFRYTKVYRPV